MSNKKVVLFSTRKIQQEGIFQSFIRDSIINKALCDYFLSVNIEKLEAIKRKYLEANLENEVCQTDNAEVDESDEEIINKKLIDWKNELNNFLPKFNSRDRQMIQFLIKDNTLASINSVITALNNLEDETEDKKTFSKMSIELEKLLKKLKEQDSASQFTIKDFDTCSSEIWDNNNDVSANMITLADRVSLYGFPGHQGDYAVYAVWPLIEPCINDLWQNSLSNAIIEKDPECDEIILWLHDNDLENTKQSTFRILQYKKVEKINNRDIKLSIGIFAHPDSEFNNILFKTQDGEENIYKAVDDLFSTITKMKKCNENYILENKYISLAK